MTAKQIIEGLPNGLKKEAGPNLVDVVRGDVLRLYEGSGLGYTLSLLGKCLQYAEEFKSPALTELEERAKYILSQVAAAPETWPKNKDYAQGEDIKDLLAAVEAGRDAPDEVQTDVLDGLDVAEEWESLEEK